MFEGVLQLPTDPARASFEQPDEAPVATRIRPCAMEHEAPSDRDVPCGFRRGGMKLVSEAGLFGQKLSRLSYPSLESDLWRLRHGSH